MTGYPWNSGDELDASDLNNAIASCAPAVALTNANAALSAAEVAQASAVAAQGGADAAQAAATAAAAAAVAAQTTANAAMPKVGGTVIATGSTASRTLESRFADFLCVKDFGAKGDGVTDDSIALQAALNACAAAGGGIVYAPPTGKPYFYRTGLQIPGGVKLMGASTKSLQGGNTNVAAWSAAGTWFQCVDMVNPAVSMGTVSVVAHGAALSGVNFIYSQPTPGATWSPTIYPWAVKVMSDHILIEDVMVVGGTYGINLEAPNESGIGAGIRLRNIYLSTYIRGLRTYKINDTITIDTLFVNDQTYAAGFAYPVVVSFLLANLVGWEIDYCDNALVNNMYLFLCNTGLLCTDETILGNTHSLYNAQMSNIQTVLCRQAISVANSSTTLTAVVSNWNAQSDDASTTTFFNLPSDNVDLSINNLTIPWVGGKLLELGGGSGGRLLVGGLNVSAYSAISVNQPCLQANAGATLALGTRSIAKTGSAGTKLVGAGADEIDTPYNQSWQPYSTANSFSTTGSGAFTAFSLTNWFNPVSAGIIQGRMIGTINIATAAAGGTATLRLEAFPEITTAALSTTSAGNVMFDTNWIDISSPSHSLGRVMVSASSGAVIQNAELTVLFR